MKKKIIEIENSLFYFLQTDYALTIIIKLKPAKFFVFQPSSPSIFDKGGDMVLYQEGNKIKLKLFTENQIRETIFYVESRDLKNEKILEKLIDKVKENGEKRKK